MTTSILTLRIHAGFNANAFLAAILGVGGVDGPTATAFLKTLFSGTDAEVHLYERSVNGIAGRTLELKTPSEARGHVHRHPGEILDFYAKSRLTPAARSRAERVWRVLAAAEGRVHGAVPEDVHFHEVGRMANVYAIGLAAALWENLGAPELVVSPIPLGDGTVKCAHGAVPYPAPAMQAMLEGVAVRGYAGEGEPVTPTGLAVLLGFGARFGAWPAMTVERTFTVFTKGVFEGVPNGTIAAYGETLPREALA